MATHPIAARCTAVVFFEKLRKLICNMRSLRRCIEDAKGDVSQCAAEVHFRLIRFAGIHAFLYVAIQMHHQMILDGSYVGVIMRVAKYTVDCAVALGAPLGFGPATNNSQWNLLGSSRYISKLLYPPTTSSCGDKVYIKTLGPQHTRMGLGIQPARA